VSIHVTDFLVTFGHGFIKSARSEDATLASHPALLVVLKLILPKTIVQTNLNQDLPFASVRKSLQTLSFLLNAELLLLDTVLNPAGVEIVFGGRFDICYQREN
jgi:hypothetical protein